MLVMTCSVGGTIRIGQEVQVTVQSRSWERVTVGVIAPPGTDLHFDGVSLQPFVLPSGTHSYFFSLRAIRRFRVNEIEVDIWLPGDALSLAADNEDCIHLGIGAPRELQVSYESHDGIHLSDDLGLYLEQGDGIRATIPYESPSQSVIMRMQAC